MKKLNFRNLAFFAFATLGLASCGYVEEIDNNEPEQSQEAIVKDAYQKGFTAIYGQVNANQNWDFSHFRTELATRAISQTSLTKVDGIDFDINATVQGSYGNYSVKNTLGKNTAIYNKINEVLADGKTHTGETAVLVNSSTGFLLYPLTAQGAFTYTLYVEVTDPDGTVHTQEIFTKNWTDYSHAYVNGMYYGTKTERSGYSWQTVVDTSTITTMPGYYIEAPVGSTINIYLANIKNGNTTVTTAQVGTKTGSAIVVDCGNTRPEIEISDAIKSQIEKNIEGIVDSEGVQVTFPDDAEVKFVGIEDCWENNKVAGDKDYNDIVLALVGAVYIPQDQIIPASGEYDVVTENVKRYMVEDLGDTDDFDFNDIVLDLSSKQLIHHRTSKVGGVVIKDEITGTSYELSAIVRHLGGTHNWELVTNATSVTGEDGKVSVTGDHVSGVRYGVMDYGDETTPADVIDVSGKYTYEQWNEIIANNKIAVIVDNAQTTEGVTTSTVTFPANGSIPMMIATDKTRTWMPERQTINWGPFQK